MVGDYISRDYLLDEYDRQHQGPPGGARKIIAEAPAADVAPARHASWIEDGYYNEPCVCSNCGEPCKDTVMGKPRWNYCPNCGADMREPPKEGNMMNYCYNAMETATDMTPSVPVERENLKMLMRMTNERLNEAVASAEAILSEIRGAFPRKDDERVNVSSAMDAERLNRDMAERLCGTLKEIALQMGVGA